MIEIHPFPLPIYQKINESIKKCNSSRYCNVSVTITLPASFSQALFDYHGFFTRSFSLDDTIQKFKRLAGPVLTEGQMEDLIYTIRHLDDLSTMMPLIEQIAATGTIQYRG